MNGYASPYMYVVLRSGEASSLDTTDNEWRGTDAGKGADAGKNQTAGFVRGSERKIRQSGSQSEGVMTV